MFKRNTKDTISIITVIKIIGVNLAANHWYSNFLCMYCISHKSVYDFQIAAEW